MRIRYQLWSYLCRIFLSEECFSKKCLRCLTEGHNTKQRDRNIVCCKCKSEEHTIRECPLIENPTNETNCGCTVRDTEDRQKQITIPRITENGINFRILQYDKDQFFRDIRNKTVKQRQATTRPAKKGTERQNETTQIRAIDYFLNENLTATNATVQVHREAEKDDEINPQESNQTLGNTNREREVIKRRDKSITKREEQKNNDAITQNKKSERRENPREMT